MQKTTGWVVINRETRARIFAQIDDHGPGAGRPPRKDIAKFLVLTIAEHAEYVDDPKSNRRRGTWRTSYAEIESITGYNKDQIRRCLMYLEKQRLITKGNEFPTCLEDFRQPRKILNATPELAINALFYEELTSMVEKLTPDPFDNNRQVTSNAVPPKSLKEEYKRDPADPGTGGGLTSLGRGGAFTSLKALKALKDESVNVKSNPPTPNPNGNGKSHPKSQEPPTTAPKQTHPVTQALESKLRGREPKGARGANGGKNGKLVASREGYTPQEAIEIISLGEKNAHRAKLGIERAVGAVPLVNLLVRVGVQEIYKTHLVQLVRAHRAATQGDPNQFQTWLYEAISKMEKDGRRFGSVPEVFEALKEG